jgi:hypothetical protein|tara:strand:+ start:14 stop:274 length:261 start_codon:yes stop_codon:yes gene_type:complete
MHLHQILAVVTVQDYLEALEVEEQTKDLTLEQELQVQEIPHPYLPLKETMVDFLMDQHRLELVVEVELDQLALMHQVELEELVEMV